MKKYHHLTPVEREQISMLRQSKSSITEIALALGRPKSTISRELKRNQAPPGQYWPDTAQTLALSRRRRGFKGFCYNQALLSLLDARANSRLP